MLCVYANELELLLLEWVAVCPLIQFIEALASNIVGCGSWVWRESMPAAAKFGCACLSVRTIIGALIWGDVIRGTSKLVYFPKQLTFPAGR